MSKQQTAKKPRSDYAGPIKGLDAGDYERIADLIWASEWTLNSQSLPESYERCLRRKIH